MLCEIKFKLNFNCETSSKNIKKLEMIDSNWELLKSQFHKFS